MQPLPKEIAARYRRATTREVRSWSFGALRLPRVRRQTGRDEAERSDANSAISLAATRGTLDDQAIFGPKHDDRCACGKYDGARHQGTICDRCGVKVTSSSSRRERFAHVEFGVTVPHPFAVTDETLEAFPVLPAAFVEAPRGVELASVYERLIDAAGTGKAVDLRVIIAEVCNLILPALVSAHDWNLRDAEMIARGLALVGVAETPVIGLGE